MIAAALLATSLMLIPVATSETDVTVTYHTEVVLTVDEPSYLKAVGLTFSDSNGIPDMTNSYVGSVPKSFWHPTVCGFGEVGRRAYLIGNGVYISNSTTLGSFDFTYLKNHLPGNLGLVGEGITLDCSSWVNLDWQVIYPDVSTEPITMSGDCDWDGDVDFDDITPFVESLGSRDLKAGDPADLDGDGDCDFDDVNLFIEKI